MALIATVVLIAFLGWLKVQQRIQGLPAGLGVVETIQVENEIWRTPLQVGGGLIVFVGLILTAWRISVSDKQVGVSQQGQLTDRFSRAIEHLGGRDGQGNPALEIRLGGIYALERIAFDSPRDHWTIMEVLLAYLRERRSWFNPAGFFVGSAQDRDEFLDALDLKEQESKEPPPVDIQAVVTVLGRRRHAGREPGRLRISRVDLANSKFPEGSNFEGVSFLECNLRGALFSRSNLRRATFDASVLYEATFYDCDLRDASFLQAHLRATKVPLSDVKGLNIRDAQVGLLIDLSEEQVQGIDVVPVVEITRALALD